MSPSGKDHSIGDQHVYDKHVDGQLGGEPLSDFHIPSSNTITPEARSELLPKSRDEISFDTALSAPTEPPHLEPQVSENDVSKRKLWIPIWLRLPVLLGFLALFIGMIIAIAILNHLSRDWHGIVSQINKNQYSWTYGPTALLVAIASLWGRADHTCKLLLPWQELKGGASVTHFLLLDYISPMTPIVLWTAGRSRHWSVFASILMLLLLKLTVGT